MEQSDLITLEQVAEITNAPLNTVRYWRAMGQGPRFARIGRRVMARRSEVEAWIDAQFD
ncbi:helix-turn-helix transcriptional regulator [Mycobacterium paraffinicum]|uniref:Helix-turn-helix domain-containing protein n=1 Tax=Mycobacterium paraffinicum TaxID=53378 RepID=A0ABP8F957_9MYCO|nr:helix-turn-helix domain-containing protein [Mycobacterium paraffinicum]MCV7309875.1 helix-turn-helix domain-containing protein [Mycobacterium paraffinicum]